MSFVTLEHYIQQQLEQNHVTSRSFSMPDGIHREIVYRELDIALSALYLIQHAIGQNQIITWDNDLMGRIGSFHQVITAMRDWAAPFQMMAITDFIVSSVPNSPEVDQELRHHLEQAIQVLEQALHRVAQVSTQASYMPRDHAQEPYHGAAYPTKWHVVVAFTALHALQTIITQTDQREIVKRIHQLEQAIEYWWQVE